MPTLVVAERPQTEDARACLNNGADGYLDAALDAVLGIATGELAYGRDVIGHWLRAHPHQRDGVGIALTPRDRDLIELIDKGRHRQGDPWGVRAAEVGCAKADRPTAP